MSLLSPSAPLWSQAFRPMFLLAAIFSALALIIWGLYYEGYPLPSLSGGVFWHSHEMVFGFASAVVAGFLLTAVQNWTGRRAINGKPLMLLAGVWLLARVLMLCGNLVPWWLTAAVDLLFLPMVAWFFFSLLKTVGQKRNYFFSAVMLVMTVMNALMHWGNASGDFSLVLWGGRASSLMIVLFITVIGGRVMPMFTANGAGLPRVPSIEWLDKAVLGSMWLLVALFVTTLDGMFPRWLMGLLCFVAATLQAVRVARLQVWKTMKVPLVWSLHLAYWFIPVGLVLMGLHYFNFDIAFSTALHSLTAGAIGGAILAMIARVSLGHSGRRLIPHGIMTLAFALVLTAALVRSVLVAIVPDQSLLFIGISVVLWVAAYLIFVVMYAKIMLTPRPDGRPF